MLFRKIVYKSFFITYNSKENVTLFNFNCQLRFKIDKRIIESYKHLHERQPGFAVE